MQFRIPQNVQREDTIIGPITFKQLAILLVGGIIAYVIYLFMAKALYTNATILIAVAPVVLLTLAVSFLKIKDMSFLTALLYLAEYMFKPRVRVWRQGEADVRLSVLKPLPNELKHNSKKEAELSSREKRNKLLELSKNLNKINT